MNEVLIRETAHDYYRRLKKSRGVLVNKRILIPGDGTVYRVHHSRWDAGDVLVLVVVPDTGRLANLEYFHQHRKPKGPPLTRADYAKMTREELGLVCAADIKPGLPKGMTVVRADVAWMVPRRKNSG